jgi:hypothetical protein
MFESTGNVRHEGMQEECYGRHATYQKPNDIGSSHDFALLLAGGLLTLSLQVVQHMGTMDQPWNCPHGRPTMRHLSDIANMGCGTARTVNWAAFPLP